MTSKVGIVIVTHNAAAAVRVTLASLSHAENATPFELIVIDNASEPREREEIRRAFDRYAAHADRTWQYVQANKNLGFAGANNIGIRRFADDAAISHVCLLNSDVVLSHFWLDRLVEKRCDVVSPVTNQAHGAQCIPVRYELELAECSDACNVGLAPMAFALIDRFAQDRYRAWQGNTVAAEVTFFCVLLSKALVLKVGLLDETFFPGGYEDNDYCARIRACGYEIHLARDVYIHHWGGASFGRLPEKSFNDYANKNKSYFETKHRVVVKRHWAAPLLSYWQDVAFALKGGGQRRLQRRFLAFHKTELTGLLRHYERKFTEFQKLFHERGLSVPDRLQEKIAAVTARGSLDKTWSDLCAEVDRAFARAHCGTDGRRGLEEKFEALIAFMYATVECDLLMAAHGQAHLNDVLVPLAKRSITVAPRIRMRRLFWKLARYRTRAIKTARWFWSFDGIVFFAGYPYPDREKDGYFQRVRSVDSLFADRWRVYVELTAPGRESAYDFPNSKTLVLRIGGRKAHTLATQVGILLCVLRCRLVYYHSVLRMRGRTFTLPMLLPGVTKIIDIHGVVPEEYRYHNDFFNACLHEEYERLAVEKSALVVVVSAAMAEYFRGKYRDALRGAIVVMPTFPALPQFEGVKPYVGGRPIVVYAGGLHKWQQVSKMLDAIGATHGKCVHKFFCPTPERVIAMLPKRLRRSADIIIEAKTHDELLQLYPECHYGFVLREDIVVNHVACPTKLVEYLAMGIVPIMDCENIGDFHALGMQSVRLADFRAGRLPSESARKRMVEDNFEVYQSLREQHRIGVDSLKNEVARLRRSLPSKAIARLVRAKANIGQPATTTPLLTGKSLSSQRAQLASPGIGAARSIAFPHALPRSDVVMQVGNMVLGGLETVVLDISSALIDAGLRVSILVLGEAGVAAEQARKKGIPLCVTPFDADTYQENLLAADPRAVFAHYSFKGADICTLLNVSLVQVIHNAYMWFSTKEAREFSYAIEHSAKAVAVSEFVKSYSIARLGVPPEKCIVIPNGIDTSRIAGLDKALERRRLRQKYGISDDDIVFLSVGSITHQKNALGLARAFGLASQNCSQAKLVLLGAAYEQAILQELMIFVSQHGLQQKVIYAGETEDPYPYYALGDVFLNGSFFEGSSLAFLEALVADLPIVATDTGAANMFRGHAGVALVPPAIDLFTYRGGILQLHSTSRFEQALAAEIQKMYAQRVRPGLDEHEVRKIDKRNSYRSYVDLLNELAPSSPAVICGDS